MKKYCEQPAIILTALIAEILLYFQDNTENIIDPPETTTPATEQTTPSESEEKTDESIGNEPESPAVDIIGSNESPAQQAEEEKISFQWYWIAIVFLSLILLIVLNIKHYNKR